ncbi:zinc finger protein 674-like [Mizuhopecten yessoensis]|uniref:Zinc finger protein 782 n=1 Tax=Mizuhopecten yessoensis TaxID=6573 RepID=A0A210QXZ8_MIZYE|nr:zinc finger protein 674-like [Mizuhopecten yessoensis]XP_021346922.1 zinc finger protein 674-like [Mizuhopecten yessoensis]OWF53594.1 Zinc finger protein 782 [Mizuhopecten yessoensis]
MYGDIYQSTNSSSKGTSSDNSLDAVDFKMKTTDTAFEASSLSPMDGESDSYDIGRYIQHDNHLYNSEKEFTSIPSAKQFRFIDFEKRNLRCTHCTYVTDRKNNLKRHIVTMHQECPKTLDCCGIVFRSKAALREHVSFHHRGGYRCQICGRNFCRKALLRRHLTVHSGQKDYRCRHCAYATSHKSNLERHQKVHAKDAGKHGSITQNIFEDAFDNRKPNIDNVSHKLAKWRLETASLQDVFYGQICKNNEKEEHLKLNEEQIMQQNRIFNWMNFNMAFSSLGRNPIRARKDQEETIPVDVIRDINDNIDNAKAKCDEQSPSNPENEQNSVKESFALYLKRYLMNETDESSNDETNDENKNNESENSENLPVVQDAPKLKRCRLSANPYKCSACGSTYASQKGFLKHGCGKAVKSGLYFPVTNMIQKGVALAEQNAKISSEESTSLHNTYLKSSGASPLTETTGVNIDSKAFSESAGTKSAYTYIL